MNTSISFQAVCAAALLLLCPAVHGESPEVADLILKGDAYDQTFHAAEALQFYLPAEKLEPANVRNLVRIARQYRHLMTDAKKQETKLQLGKIAMDYSNRAAALGPNDSDAQIAIGITCGKMLPLQGTKEQLEASSRIKASADKAIEVNPLNDTAWYVLGRWHKAVTEVSAFKRTMGGLIYGKLPTSTYEAAASCFEKAIAINPTRLMHYIELGRTYAQSGKKEEARRYLAKGLAMPDLEKDDPETKKRGKETLAKLR